MTLNEQVKRNKDGSIKSRGIEWCSHTWNPVTGCKHGCEWTMPDGTAAECYAKTIADKFRSPNFMPDGFEVHGFHENRLDEPLKLKQPAKIFLDSFSDLMGHWVPDEQIEQVLDVCRRAHWHTFQLLTKNAPRLAKFDFPPNVWVGVSAPPSHMNGKPLDSDQQVKMLYRSMSVLKEVNASVRWMSIEPLSFNVGGHLLTSGEIGFVPDWVVIGAASNGPRTYQPRDYWMRILLGFLNHWDVPVFFKGNLRGGPYTDPWREEFPSTPVRPVSSIP